MAAPRSTLTRRAVISYNHYKDLWSNAGIALPDLLVEDYQGILQDFIFTSDEIDGLESRVIINTENIQINAENIETHVTSNSEHGVTGVNVGTEDFCTELVGGVALLSEIVADAVASTQEITLIDIVAAPASYDQAYTQLMADMANDTKAKHNQLVVDVNAAITQINDIISKAKTAKQMSM